MHARRRASQLGYLQSVYTRPLRPQQDYRTELSRSLHARVNKPYLIKSESETPYVVGKYMGWCAAKGYNVKRFNTDNALAFVSNKTRFLIASNTVRTSQQYLRMFLVKTVFASASGALWAVTCERCYPCLVCQSRTGGSLSTTRVISWH